MKNSPAIFAQVPSYDISYILDSIEKTTKITKAIIPRISVILIELTEHKIYDFNEKNIKESLIPDKWIHKVYRYLAYEKNYLLNSLAPPHL